MNCPKRRFENPETAEFCGKCRTKAEGDVSDPTDAEKKAVGNEKNIRLACQTRLAGDVSIFIDEKGFFRGARICRKALVGRGKTD